MPKYPRAPLDMSGDYRSPMTGKFIDVVGYDDHVSDVRHIEETVARLREPTEACAKACTYPDCDCHASEVVMLSSGYADVYQGGDVVQYGKIIYVVE